MKIKSTFLQVLAAGIFCVGLLYAMGVEGTAQVGGTISDGQFITAMLLILASIFLMRVSFAVQDREALESKGRHGCGKITRNHARNPEYPENQERGA